MTGKNNRKSFEEIMENTVISAGSDKEKQNYAEKSIENMVNTIMPKRLYRFRKCCELNFDAFYEDKVYISRGIDVNDVYDTFLHYDIDKISNDLDIWNYESIIDELYWSDDFLNLVKNNFQNQQCNSDEIVIKSKEYVKKMISDLQFNLKNRFSQENLYITETIKKGIRYACFSENIKSPMMWGHYADSSTGFALEYDFKNEIIDKVSNECDYERKCRNSVNCFMYPVIYNQKMYDATDFALYLF